MKHTECKDCKLSNGDCGHHFKMDETTNFDIPSLSACDKYGNCEFFKSKEKPKGDLISREALKKATKSFTDCDGFNPVWQIIDNAPTVETSKIEHKAYNEGFKDGVEQGIKLSETPGEWINQFIGGNECVMCSECKLHFDIGTNYCPNCGAKMQKRGNK